MCKLPSSQFFNTMEFSRSLRLLKKDELYNKLAYRILIRFQWSKSDSDELKGGNGNDKLEKVSTKPGNKIWMPESAWLGKAVDQVLQLYKRAFQTGNGVDNKPPPTDISLAKIYSSIQRSKLGVQAWTVSDIVVASYFLYLGSRSTSVVEDVKGELVSSESVVQDLIYNTELAKGAYRENVAALARHTMLRERNIMKFVKESSVLRPGYYIAIDMRNELVVVCIRGTHTLYDLLTDIITDGHEEITLENYSTHFGAAEAARWLLSHEIHTIRRYLKKHEGFRLRLVGHSLGGATASLLAIMLRGKSFKELGFSPDIVTAVGFATPPCVSKELSERCSEFVTTVVMQGDIIPRLSAASLTRLRNELVDTDFMSILPFAQDVARILADYTNFNGQTKDSEVAVKKKVSEVAASRICDPPSTSCDNVTVEKAPEELFVPGSVYILKRNVDGENTKHICGEYFTLLRRKPGEHFQRIIFTENFMSDHKCESHYYALRDVLKGLPRSLIDDRNING